MIKLTDAIKKKQLEKVKKKSFARNSISIHLGKGQENERKATEHVKLFRMKLFSKPNLIKLYENKIEFLLV
jgi:hypothetical protein